MAMAGRTDAYKDKPKFPVEQFQTGLITLSANATPSGTNTIAFPQGSTTLIAANQVANGVNVASTLGLPGFNLINGPLVVSKTSNSVTLSANVVGNINAGQRITFSKPMLSFNNHTADSYNANTVYVSVTRMKTANHWANVQVSAPGHVHVRRGSGGRAGRIQTETLVVISNTSATITGSGGPFYSGL